MEVIGSVFLWRQVLLFTENGWNYLRKIETITDTHCEHLIGRHRNETVLKLVLYASVESSEHNKPLYNIVEKLQMWNEATFCQIMRISSPLSSFTVNRRNWWYHSSRQSSWTLLAGTRASIPLRWSRRRRGVDERSTLLATRHREDERFLPVSFPFAVLFLQDSNSHSFKSTTSCKPTESGFPYCFQI